MENKVRSIYYNLDGKPNSMHRRRPINVGRSARDWIFLFTDIKLLLYWQLCGERSDFK